MNIAGLHLKIKAGDLVDPSEFSRVFDSGLDYSQVLKLRRLWSLNQQASQASCDGENSIRVAVTGSGTLDYFADCLNDSLVYLGYSTTIFVSSYNNYTQDLMDPASDLQEFQPDCVVFVNDSSTVWSLMSNDQVSSDDEPTLRQIDTNLGFIAGLLKPLSGSGCDVLIANAIPEPVDSPGSIRRRYSKSSWNVVQHWNNGLERFESLGIRVVDVCFLAMRHGINSAFSYKQWYESKLPYDLDFHSAVASLVSFDIVSARVADKKVLVLDCDNTIWGGVVGDDGLDGIEIGTISARAQGYQGLQRHIKRLKELGFLLAIASKNEEDSVLEVFRTQSDMVLRESDIVSFKVNWRSKADNIAEMAEDLDLGLDSFVFLDDNPAEISMVNQFLPEVETILASEDPVVTLKYLHDSRLLFRTSISNDDGARTQQYHVEKQRKQLAESVTNYDEYLSSLEMRAEIELITPATAVRASQLINKSNQFNLTTIRRTESEVLSLIDSEEWKCYIVRLSDKFGEHGIISVLITQVTEQDLFIETFVMSCRVLKRGVEALIINHLAQVASSAGLGILGGLYSTSPKNKIVANLYDELGFEKLSESNGNKRYLLELSSYKNANCYIDVNVKIK